MPATATRREHLQTYSRVDIALDTFPYAGATTTCEALFMGVPVVTCAGDRHASRLGVCVLSAVGLQAWIAPTHAAYVELAAQHARDRPALSALRSRLRASVRASSLYDGRRIARAIEHWAEELSNRRKSAH